MLQQFFLDTNSAKPTRNTGTFARLFGTLAIGWIAIGFDSSAHSANYRSSVVGTDFDFITTDDPSAFDSLKFVEAESAEMPDKRFEDGPLFKDAFVFEAKFTDGVEINLYIDQGFGSQEAAKTEARRYVDPLGRLPAILRKGVDRLVVHQGGKETTAFSDVGLIVMYSENAMQRISTHDLEETIFHESIHAAWDASYARCEGWKRAQHADGNFATVYAKSKPGLEDLAETALFAYTILYHPQRLPDEDRMALQQSVPHRIAFIAELFAADESLAPVTLDAESAINQ
jgi:hypothetical protein